MAEQESKKKFKQVVVPAAPIEDVAPTAPEMTLEEARAYRASLHKPTEKVLSAPEKREEFRRFWAREKYKYGMPKNLEEVIWLHLKAVKKDEPNQFEEGIAHFGLKKI